MRRISILLPALFILLSVQVNAQNRSRTASHNSDGMGTNYDNSLGLSIDFGTGGTLAGPTFKHFFDQRNAGQFEILFGDHYTIIDALYEYHGQVPNASGLKWYLGIGPGVGLFKGGSNFLIRPLAGLDYKINNVPLSFSFDWRPTLTFLDNHYADDTDFEPARFGLGFRYAF